MNYRLASRGIPVSINTIDSLPKGFKMKQNKLFFVIAGIIFFSLFFFSIEKTESNDRWTLFGETSVGEKYYYDKDSIINIKLNVIKVREKKKVTKVLRDSIVKQKRDQKLPVNGWDKLEDIITLEELDCKKKTTKMIQMTIRDNKGKVLDKWDYKNPEIEQTIPGSISETLLKTVCQNK
jgi:hypothetical protein